MGERLKNIPKQIVEWWSKFSKKQKTILISSVVGTLITLCILGFVLSRPKMVVLIDCATTKEASTVKQLLDSNSITSEVSRDGLQIKVNQKDESNAVLLLGSNDIPAKQFDLNSVFDGGFSTTETDKDRKYQRYLEEKIQSHLESMDAVKSAFVSLSIPAKDGTILSQDRETSASVMLTLNSQLGEAEAGNLARFIATAVGNKGTSSITLIDSQGNPLFSGADATTGIGAASSQLSVRSKMENMVKAQVRDVLLGTRAYDQVEVGLNLDINFDQIKQVENIFSVAEGREEGYKDTESTYEMESTGGIAGTPGTDTNDAPNYVMEDNNYSTQNITERQTKYTPNETIRETLYATGAVTPANSSITVVANRYRVYREDDLRAQGTLNGTTFDKFMAENSEQVKAEVDADLFPMVARATGIPQENISIVSYEIPFFEPSANTKGFMDYLQIAMAVLILALLGFVVFKSTRPAEVLETEPELSVEALLETTKEGSTPLEDIDFNEKSEARIMIERFVDENPEAAASLLRNWLNEDWE